ncbi:MAG: hypothetical protein ABIQ39_02055 [Ilumatobacteraceae bacterium]
MRVQVFHNVEDHCFYGYKPEHQMTKVLVYYTQGTREEALNEAFHILNVGEIGIAGHYRERRNRSLSVGDVIALDGEAHSCDPFGWNEVDMPVDSKRTVHGSTHYAEPMPTD